MIFSNKRSCKVMRGHARSIFFFFYIIRHRLLFWKLLSK